MTIALHGKNMKAKQQEKQIKNNNVKQTYVRTYYTIKHSTSSGRQFKPDIMGTVAAEIGGGTSRNGQYNTPTMTNLRGVCLNVGKISINVTFQS